MLHSDTLEFSFSGLKTSFLYFLKKMTDEEKFVNIDFLASSFQEAVFQTLIGKTHKAMKQTGINRLVLGGGVSVNRRLRNLLRALVDQESASGRSEIYFPPYKYLNFDNAAMIGVVGAYKAERGMFVKDLDEIERIPRLSLLQSSI
jgi:N6-L-threonylcarbamoyladenine synthase